MILVAVDSGFCHYFAVKLSDERYHRPKYMEAFYNSIEMIFKKLKYHKGKMEITITEIEDESKDEETTGEVGEISLEPGEVPTVQNANKSWNTGVQEELSKRERQNKFLQGGDVENLEQPKGRGIIDT